MGRALAAAAVLAFTAACGSSAPLCPTPEARLAEAVACSELAPIPSLVEALAGRALTSGQRERAWTELEALARADLAPLRGHAAWATARLAELDGLTGTALSKARSQLLWQALHGTGDAWPREGLPETTAVLRSAAAVWEHDDTAQLVLTETDIEGWIHYVSLQREVQGGGPLKLAIADRVPAYTAVRARWRSGSEADKLTLSAFGAVWPEVRRRWLDASYETQQAWIREAPLPPPMTATSSGYLTAVTEGPIAAHLVVLEARLGPLPRRLP